MIVKGGSWCKAMVTMTFVLADHTLKRRWCNLYTGISVVEPTVNPHR
jgi:hypothetical protein